MEFGREQEYEGTTTQTAWKKPPNHKDVHDQENGMLFFNNKEHGSSGSQLIRALHAWIHFFHLTKLMYLNRLQSQTHPLYEFLHLRFGEEKGVQEKSEQGQSLT
jgi:hypothetical protein